MPLSFISPSFRAVMIKQGEDPREAFARGVRTGSQQVLSRTISELELTISAGGVISGQAIMTLPYTEMREFIDSADFPITSDRVFLIQFGYSDSDDISPIYRLTTGSPAIEYQDTGQITWTLNGAGIHAVTRTTPKVHPTHTHPEKALGVIKDLAAKLGYEVRTVDEKGFPSRDSKFPKKLTDPTIWKAGMVQMMQNDLQFITLLCRMANANFYVDGGYFVIFDRDSVRTSRPVVTLKMWGRIDSANYVYPIEAFNVTSQQWFKPGSSSATVERQGTDPATTKSGNTDAISTDEEARGMEGNPEAPAFGEKLLKGSRVNAEGEQVTLSPQYAQGQTGRQFIVSFRDTIGAQKIAAARQDGVDAASLQAEVETIGIPKLLPMQVVKVEGAGKRFDGNYTIFRLTHSISSSGYRTSMTLSRATMSGAKGVGSKGKRTLTGTGQGVQRQTSSGAAGEGNTKEPVNAKVGERTREPKVLK